MKKDEVKVTTQDSHKTRYTDPVTDVSINGESIWKNKKICRCCASYLMYSVILSIIVGVGSWWVTKKNYHNIDSSLSIRTLVDEVADYPDLLRVKDSSSYRLKYPKADVDGNGKLSFIELVNYERRER